jgi:hypothetical protein
MAGFSNQRVVLDEGKHRKFHEDTTDFTTSKRSYTPGWKNLSWFYTDLCFPLLLQPDICCAFWRCSGLHGPISNWRKLWSLSEVVVSILWRKYLVAIVWVGDLQVMTVRQQYCSPNTFCMRVAYAWNTIQVLRKVFLVFFAEIHGYSITNCPAVFCSESMKMTTKDMKIEKYYILWFFFVRVLIHQFEGLQACVWFRQFSYFTSTLVKITSLMVVIYLTLLLSVKTTLVWTNLQGLYSSLGCSWEWKMLYDFVTVWKDLLVCLLCIDWYS